MVSAIVGDVIFLHGCCIPFVIDSINGGYVTVMALDGDKKYDGEEHDITGWDIKKRDDFMTAVRRRRHP